MAVEVSVINDSGRGRTFALLTEMNEYEGLALELSQVISQKSRAVCLRVPFVSHSNWQEVTEGCYQVLSELKVRQASLVGFGPACNVVQNMCLRDLRRVRTAVHVDAATRPHSTPVERIIDRVESFLPLGLPFRVRSQGFHAKPFLQRMRCPTLVVTTPRASEYIKGQAEILVNTLPTAWRLNLHDEREMATFAEAIQQFQDVPAKCPQKALARKEKLESVGT